MLSVSQCESARQMRLFFRLSALFGYRGAEARYLQRFVHPAVNPLAGNGPMCFLIAQENGKITGRVLTYRDERYIAATGRNRGFFALFDALDARTGAKLLERVGMIQRQWGSEEILGPVSPNGSGFFQGLSDHETGALLSGKSHFAAHEALKRAGFVEEGWALSYQIAVPAQNPFAELAKKVQARFQMQVERFDGLGGKGRLARCVSQASAPHIRADLMREFGHIAPLIAPRFSFAVIQNGVCVGYLLSIRDRKTPLRIATLETAEGAYTPAVAALILDAICESCREQGLQTVNVSTIEADNFPSWSLVQRFSVREKCKFYRYIQKVSNI